MRRMQLRPGRRIMSFLSDPIAPSHGSEYQKRCDYHEANRRRMAGAKHPMKQPFLRDVRVVPRMGENRICERRHRGDGDDEDRKSLTHRW